MYAECLLLSLSISEPGFFNRPDNDDNPYLSPEKQNCALKAFAPNDQTLALNIN